MKLTRAETVRRALKLSEAFPAEDQPLVILGIHGDDDREVKEISFRVCRLCGSLVRENMTNAHILTLNHDEITL